MSASRTTSNQPWTESGLTCGRSQPPASSRQITIESPCGFYWPNRGQTALSGSPRSLRLCAHAHTGHPALDGLPEHPCSGAQSPPRPSASSDAIGQYNPHGNGHGTAITRVQSFRAGQRYLPFGDLVTPSEAGATGQFGREAELAHAGQGWPVMRASIKRQRAREAPKGPRTHEPKGKYCCPAALDFSQSKLVKEEGVLELPWWRTHF